MQNIGVLGLGIMGSRMAKNLIRAGFQATVWNRTRSRCDDLAAMGAGRAETPREVVETCPVTFAMLSDPCVAEEICFGKDGVLEGIGSGKGYVDMSTVDPFTAQRIGAAVTGAGGRFLEAPVSGSRKPAEEAKLVILAAGDRSLYDEVAPCFARMGKKTVFLGAAGNGARMKLVVNLIMGGMMAVFCEGLALGEAAGLSPADLLDVLGAGGMANPMFSAKGPLIAGNDFAASFPLKHMQKDLRLAVALGDRLGQPLHSAGAANETFKRAVAMGLGEEDFSAVYKAVRRPAPEEDLSRGEYRRAG